MTLYIRLKKSSKRDKLITSNNCKIVKNEWSLVDEHNKEIKKIVLFRKDIDTVNKLPKQKKTNKKNDK